MERPRPNFQHLPALDGLRGVAVLAVVWFHLGGRVGRLMPGGYLGVDVFFVLSGFLITSILVREFTQTQRIDLKAFWVRRARRLLPALLALMPAIAFYAFKFARRDELNVLRSDALSTLAYVSNWRAILSQKDYWQMFAAPSPLEHTWSLSIEEQFYVVWPLVFSMLLAQRARKSAALLCVGGAALSALLMLVFYSNASTARAYFGTDTRAAAILIGAALAFASPAFSTRALDVLGSASIAILGFMFVTLRGQAWWLYHGGFWLTEIACCVLILCASQAQEGLIAKVLSARPLRFLGTYSYGIYLWHWPIFCVVIPERVHVGGGLLVVIRLGITLAIALLSYHLLEAPLRTRGLAALWGPKPRPFAASVAFVLATFAAAFGSVALAANRAEHRFIAQNLSPFETPLRALPAHALAEGTLKVLTLGDSVSEKLGNTLRIHQRTADMWVVDRGVGNCNILEDNRLKRSGPPGTPWALGHPSPGSGCAGHWLQDVQEIRPDITFVVIGGAFLHDKVHEIFVDDVNANACEKNFQEPYVARLDQVLGEIAPYAGTLVLARAPYPGERWRHEGLLEDVDCFNAMLDGYARDHKLPMVDIATRLCPTRECLLLEEGEPIRPDGLHPECPGANALAQWTLKELRKLKTR